MNRLTKNEFLLFLCIFTLGAFLRLYHLDYPLGLHGDEAWTGIEARRILSEGWIGIWSPSALGQSTIPFYWTAFIFKLFGENIFTLRLSFALLSIFSLPFFYLTVKLLFDKNVAMIAFLFFATSHIFLLFSHVAPTHALFLVPFFPTLYFFLIALKSNRKIFFVVSGIFLGLSQYFYVGLRILLLLLVIFILYESFRKNFLKQHWKNLSLFFLISFITFLPLGMYGLQHTENFMTRTNMVNIFSQQGIEWAQSTNKNLSSSLPLLRHNIISTLLMFTKEGDHDQQDNAANLPIFDIIPGIFFIIGFLFQLKYLKKRGYAFLYIWFFLFLSGTLFTVDAPNFRRIQPTIAAAYIFVGFGILNVSTILYKILKNKLLINSLLIFIVLFIGYLDIKSYFLKQSVSEETKSIFCYPLVKTADFIKAIPNPYVYFYSAGWSYHYETLRFLLNGIPGEDRSSQFGTYSLIKNNFDKTVVYLFLPDYQDSFFEIQKMYPNGKTIIKKDTDNTIIFYSYIISKEI